MRVTLLKGPSVVSASTVLLLSCKTMCTNAPANTSEAVVIVLSGPPSFHFVMPWNCSPPHVHFSRRGSLMRSFLLPDKDGFAVSGMCLKKKSALQNVLKLRVYYCVEKPNLQLEEVCLQGGRNGATGHAHAAPTCHGRRVRACSHHLCKWFAGSGITSSTCCSSPPPHTHTSTIQLHVSVLESWHCIRVRCGKKNSLGGFSNCVSVAVILLGKRRDLIGAQWMYQIVQIAKICG